jgi:hypothetical protein
VAGRSWVAVTVADMPADLADEEIARRIVRHALPNVTVIEYDDGSLDGMVDALITYPDGRTADLEIVGDHDRAYRVVSERLTREGQVVDAPTLKYSWRITVEDTAPIRELRNEIVDLLKFIEAEPTPRELAWPDGGPLERCSRDRLRLQNARRPACATRLRQQQPEGGHQRPHSDRAGG